MDLLISNTITINENALIDYLHDNYPTYSLDEMLDYLSTPEGDAKLLEWIINSTSCSIECLDDYSYGELIDYIENNF